MSIFGSERTRVHVIVARIVVTGLFLNSYFIRQDANRILFPQLRCNWGNSGFQKQAYLQNFYLNRKKMAKSIYSKSQSRRIFLYIYVQRPHFRKFEVTETDPHLRSFKIPRLTKLFGQKISLKCVFLSKYFWRGIWALTIICQSKWALRNRKN